MTGAVIRNTLRASWKQALYWGLGMGILGLYITVIASSSEILEGYANLLGSLPPALLNAFGMGDARLMTSAEGWIVSIFATEATIILSVYAVMAGLNIAANEERDGVLDIALSLPISRTRFIVEKSIAFALISLAIILFCIFFPVMGIVMVGIEADVGKVIASLLNIYPGLLLITAVTCLLSTVMRRRAAAIGLAAAFVIGSYAFNIIGQAASGALAALMQDLSFFHYVSGEAIILDAFDPLTLLVMLAVVFICFGLSVMMFNRRDIGL